MREKKLILESLLETRGVYGAYEVGTDGFLLESLDSGLSDPEAVAAVSAVATITSHGIGNGLNLGELKWILLEFRKGKVVIARLNNKIIVVVGNPHMIFGEILMKFALLQKL